MASLRGTALAATLAVMGGVIGAVAVGGLAVVGCGDDSGPAADGGGDATADGAPDTGREAAPDARGGGDVANSDTAPDQTTMDVVVTPDTGRETGPDAREGGGDVIAADADAGSDVTTVDSPPDVQADTPPDVQADADASDGGPNAIQRYATAYGQAFCSGQGKCCPGYPGAFDQAACAASWTTQGWEFTLPANAAAYTAGHLNFNATQGAACLTALQNFACTTLGTVTAAQYSAVTTACLGVLTGTIAVGTGGCISSFECVNGYCNLPSDGGTGTCTAFVASSGTCAPGNDSPDQMCSQAGSYQPMLWCNQLAGGATGTCAAPLANGATCYVPAVSATYYDDYGCSSLLCGDDALCGDPATYPTAPPGFCENWPTDAGGG